MQNSDLTVVVQSDAPKQRSLDGIKNTHRSDTSHTDGGKDFNGKSNDYRYEINRLETFKNWPPKTPVHPHDLARDGFVYMGISDKVRCVFCGLKVFNWESGDEVSVEHRKHQPSCPFKTGQNVGNISREQYGQSLDVPPTTTATSTVNENIHTPKAEHSTAIANSTKQSFQTTPDPKDVWSSLGIIPPLNPKHPKYMMELRRLNTFSTWPSQFFQKPEDLARAGFFYLGSGDKTKCFCCNGNLMNWEAGDDPMTEHARWFPDCQYMLLIKGEDFIKSIQTNSQVSSATSLDLSRFGVNNAESNMTERSIPPEKVEALLEIGYTQEKIDSALRKAGKHLNQFRDAEALVTFMLNSEEEATFRPDGLSECQINQMLHEEEPLSTRRDLPDEKGKKELVSVLSENHEMKEQRLCKICLDGEACVVFLPCGHLVACANCSAALSNCPICRKPIKGTVRAYLA